VYAQLRYLRPRQQRWVNPSIQVAPSPHLARVRLAGPARRPDLLIVTEGMTDALTVADAGCPAVALLGVGLADKRMALTVAQRWPTQHLVVAFDAGNSGRRASAQFVELLAEVGAANRTSVLELPLAVDDLNEWRQVGDCDFRSQLSQALPRLRSVKQGLVQTAPLAPPASPVRGLGLT
ncbi:MAG: toprim domain-containing protein, partial [Actinomycetota bacterium]|nr:toprim domain-containing protein [Actinomycetota bacterium]